MLIANTAAPGNVTTDTLDKDAEGASWARVLAAALAAEARDTDAIDQDSGQSLATAGERHERRKLVALARERLIPMGEGTARVWLRRIQFACELWKRAALDPDAECPWNRAEAAYPEDLSPPRLAGAQSYTELVLRLIGENYGPMHVLQALAPEDLLAVLLLLDDAHDCRRGIRLAQARLREIEERRSRDLMRRFGAEA